MKKGLSILLIAAALFGFYGGAVNLQDVLACMKYWEKEGERSTADMNKLEDGLKQLQDNEQAYLDGQVQLAEGEKTLADGEAQYAQGLADYEAAPGKLADGEAQLAEGYSDFNNLKKLISGLNTVRKHGVSTTKKHNEYWHDGFSHTVSNSVVKRILAGEKTSDSPGLKQARHVISTTLKASEEDVKLIEGLTNTSGIVSKAVNASSYGAFNNAMSKAYNAFDDAETQLTGISKMARTYSSTIGSMLDSRLATKTDGVPQSAAMDPETGEFTNTVPFNECNLSQLETGITVLGGVITSLNNNIEQCETQIGQLDDAIAQLEAIENPSPEQAEQLKELKKQKAVAEGTKKVLEEKKSDASTSKALLEGARDGRKGAQKMLNDVISQYGSKFEVAAAGVPAFASLYGLIKALANNEIIDPVGSDESNKVFYAYMTKLQNGLSDAADMLDQKIKTIQASKKSFNDWMNGYDTLYKGKDGKGSNDLASTKSGIPYAFGQMLSNSTIRAAIDKYDKGLVNELKKYTGARKYKLQNEDFDAFDSDLRYISINIVPRAQKVLSRVKASAQIQLADGEKQLAQGKKDYAEAPAKLADAERQLADGRQQLEDGKKQLAQYEDGEQQVRDGLATLMSTEASGGLESILDRRNGDDDFDNGDEHLDLAEGLDAVDVGRGYQADSGDLITAELVKRGAGTAAGIAAGVLALLAALLSFLKKNKGAAISGCIAAIAAAGGAAVGSSAGTEFSAQAGSTVGVLPWAAAGILAGIAIVFAIVHFSNPKEATK